MKKLLLVAAIALFFTADANAWRGIHAHGALRARNFFNQVNVNVQPALVVVQPTPVVVSEFTTGFGGAAFGLRGANAGLRSERLAGRGGLRRR